MVRVALLLLCGCNQIFGIKSTDVIPSVDARFFDAQADAPFLCPAIGTVPQFSPQLVLAVSQPCLRYRTSDAGFGAAYCHDASGPNGYVAEGVIGAMLKPSVGISTPLNDQLMAVNLTPEGDQLVLGVQASGVPRLERYQRQPDASWAAIANLGLTAEAFALSGFTRAPNRHVLRLSASTGGAFEEMVDAADDNASWTSVHDYSKAELGVAVASYPSLTSDGLRLIFVGAPTQSAPLQLYYTDRAALTDRFGAAVTMPEPPLRPTPS